MGDTTTPLAAGTALRLIAPPGWRPSAEECLAIAVAGLLPLAYASPFFVPSWTPRMLLVLVALPLGVTHLVRAAWHRDRPSIAALAFMASCALSTLLAGVPLWNLRGGFARDSSLLFIGGFFGLWALARSVSHHARISIAVVATASTAVSALIGVVQLLADPDTGLFAMIGSRPSGLAVNPVYFGACMGGMAALCAHAWVRAGLPAAWRFGGGVACFSAFAHLSGSRGALLGLVVTIGVAVMRARPWSRAVGITLSFASGIAMGSAISAWAGGLDTLDRLDRGGDGRTQIWRFAVEAFVERPVFGYGLGQFRGAVQTFFDADFGRRYLTDTGSAEWPDAHNLVLQYLVVSGAVGVVCLLWFGWTAARCARGPLAWAFVAIAITWLLQPATLATAPLAALLLGASCRPPEGVAISDPSPLARRITAYAMALGCLFMASLAVVDNRLHDSLASGDVDRFTRWARVAPADPLVAATTASLQTRFRSSETGIAWSRATVELTPFDAVALATLALRLYDGGAPGESIETIERALELDRYNATALAVGEAIADRSGDRGLTELIETIRCELGECP